MAWIVPDSYRVSFAEAVKCCPPGYYINQVGWGWNEYSVQYLIDKNGQLNWTAGGTTGGLVKDARELIRENGNERKFTYYSSMGGLPINPNELPTHEEALENIRKCSTEYHADVLVKLIDNEVCDVVNEATEGGLDYEIADDLCRKMVGRILSVFDEGDGKVTPRYEISSWFIDSKSGSKRCSSAPIRGGLKDLFDSISN